jgi:hypothetical protein
VLRARKHIVVLSAVKGGNKAAAEAGAEAKGAEKRHRQWHNNKNL